MIYEIKVPNIERIIDHIKNFKTFYPWNNNEPNYSGIGLTYNPDYPYDKFRQVLGPIEGLEEEYQQSHEFDKFTSQYAEILFDYIDLPYKPIRSRIAKIDGSGNVNSRTAWHCDEHPSYCLRVNIPIVTNEHYHLQTEDHIITPKAGYAYVWDTSKIHRAFCSKQNALHRINLVLGYQVNDKESWLSPILDKIL